VKKKLNGGVWKRSWNLLKKRDRDRCVCVSIGIELETKEISIIFCDYISLKIMRIEWIRNKRRNLDLITTAEFRIGL